VRRSGRPVRLLYCVILEGLPSSGLFVRGEGEETICEEEGDGEGDGEGDLSCILVDILTVCRAWR
jgi:hypothetical protein